MEAQVANAQAQASASSETLGKFALLTVFLVTVLLIGGMIADKQRVAMAFVCGVSFFTLFGGMVIFILSGQLAAMVINYHNQQTVRMYNTMQFQLYTQTAPAPLITVEDVEQPKLEELGPSLPKFVPAVPKVDDQLKLSAYDFVIQLFKDGMPDPDKILSKTSKSPGQIQAKKPRPEVVEYLLGLGMVKVAENKMMFFDVDTYPTQRDAQNAIRSGIKERYV